MNTPPIGVLKASDVRHNDFTKNLGTDWVAVDRLGHPMARASDKDSAAKAAPAHSGLFTGKDFKPSDTEPAAAVPEPDKISAEPTSDTEPTLESENTPVEISADAEPTSDTDKTAATDPLDHDKDGKKGGNVSNRQRKPSSTS